MEYIVGRQGNQPCQITEGSVSRKHLKVICNPDGTFTIENISSTGKTYVNGVQIFRTTIDANTPIRLGEKYNTTIGQLLCLNNAPRPVTPQLQPQQVYQPQPRYQPQPQPKPKPQSQPKPQPQPQPKPQPQQQTESVSISHLADVYDEYQDEKVAIQKNNSRAQMMRMLPMIGSSGIGLLSMAIPIPDEAKAVIGVVSLIILVVALVKMFNNSSKTPELNMELDKNFRINYVCPKCGSFLGFTPHEALLNQGKCPACKTPWREKP